MADDEENDPTAPFNELESFDSLWQALKWKQIKKRVPICFSKTLHNRYFFANFVYLCYAIGILLIDYPPWLPDNICDYCVTNYTCDDASVQAELDYLVIGNRIYLGLATIHLISATLYWWAWRDHRWNDVIMIPEYLNHIEAGLYLWSAIWYPYEEDDYFGFYNMALHKIETVAAFVELFASFGWIMSWYRTYTRTIGRGYTFDDADTVAYTLTTLSSFVYIAYNIQILVDPTQYGCNKLYYAGDLMYSIGAFFYLWANLRDDGWLWWLPVAGQYGIAPGRIQTGRPVKAGLPHLLMCGSEPCARCCRACCDKDTVLRRRSIEPIEEKTYPSHISTEQKSKI